MAMKPHRRKMTPLALTWPCACGHAWLDHRRQPNALDSCLLCACDGFQAEERRTAMSDRPRSERVREQRRITWTIDVTKTMDVSDDALETLAAMECDQAARSFETICEVVIVRDAKVEPL